MTEEKAAVVNSEERSHHPFSPSKLAMIEWCPCYESRNSINERATAGTRAHAVTETGDDDDRLDDDDAAHAAACMDFYDRELLLAKEERLRVVAALWDTCKKSGSATTVEVAESMVSQVVELTETQLKVDARRFTVPVFNSKKSGGFRDVFETVALDCTTGGYIDRGFIGYDGTWAKVFDWKFGKWIVDDAKNNLQGICYVIGMFRAYPKLKKVTMFFKQPALDFVTSYTFDAADVPGLYLRVQHAVARKIESNRLGDFFMANPGVPACNFCARLGTCTKVLGFACPTAKKFAPLEFPEEITPSMAQDPKQTSLALRLAQVLAIWSAAFKTQVTDRILRREADVPEGYTLQSRSNAEVADPEKMRQVALRYITEAELLQISEFSRTAAGKIISEKAPRGQKTAMVTEFRQALLDSGALVEGIPYTFLRVASTRKDDSKSGGE